MANLFIEFQKLIKGEKPDVDLLVPLLIWVSGSEKNIEMCQRINKTFFWGNRNIYIDELTLYNTLKHIIKYPKILKDDEKTKFFYDDIATYFNWSHLELTKNINTLNIEELKPIIAKAFGYDQKQRKKLKLPKLENREILKQ